MGCRYAKEKDNNATGSGPVFSNIKTVDPTLKSDPRLPLNTREAFKLKQSWKGIKRNIDQTGIEMFVQ